MDDSEEEKRLNSLTFNQIKEIAEEGVEPDLSLKEKKELYTSNFIKFMMSSDIYKPDIYSILGEKLSAKITPGIDDRKKSESSIDEYKINDQAKILFASLADAFKVWDERSDDSSPVSRPRMRTRRSRRNSSAPTRRPRRVSRRTRSFRGGSKKTLKKRHYR